MEPTAEHRHALTPAPLDLETSTQALGEEAINLLFEKHRLNRIRLTRTSPHVGMSTCGAACCC
jgi:hypothetical protein